MKQTWKRFLAYVLTVVMILGVMPDSSVISYAEEVSKQTSEEGIVLEENSESSNTESSTEVQKEEQDEVATEEITTEEVSTEKTTETVSEEPIEASTESATETSTEMTVETSSEVTTETATTTETSTTEVATVQTDETTTEEMIKPETVEPETAQQAIQEDDTKSSEKKYIIFSDGSWDGGTIWYVNPKNKHYVFCLNHGDTMFTGRYEGIVAAGYAGKSAFKKAVALNYFYKTNGNSWGGKKNYGPVQEVIWDSDNSETAKKLTTYINHAWKVTSLNAREAGSSSYSSKLIGINKSDQDTESALKKKIAQITDSKNIINMSDSYDAATNSYKGTIKLGGSAWKYFNAGGFDGGSSDIVVDGVFGTDGKKTDACSASLDADGNLSVNIKPGSTEGDKPSSAYTVIMHINFDYKGSDQLNYLLTPEGKQNLTFDADFHTAGYFAVRVYGNLDFEGAKLYINKVDEFEKFVPGCTFRLTGVAGEANTQQVDEPLTVNDEGNYFEIDYPGYYKLVETAVPSSELTMDTTEHYVYAAYNDEGKLLLYPARKASDGSYYYDDPSSFLGGYTGPHQGVATASFRYHFPNKYSGGAATLTKNANVLVKYENGKFVYEKRTLDNVGFSFFAAEDIYINDTLVFKKNEEIYSGTQWGGYTVNGNNNRIYNHRVLIDGKLVNSNGMAGPMAQYRGYTANGGKITISDLPAGTYYCVESDLTHPGLVIAINRHYFDVVAGKTETVNGSEGIVNEQAPADVYVYKQDYNTKEYLQGAELTIYANINNTNYDGQKLFNVNQAVDVVVERNLATGEEKVESNTWIPIQTSTTNERGVAVFDNLPYGDYLIAEVKAPEGYELPENTIRFTHVLPENAENFASGFVSEHTIGDITTSDFKIYKNAEKAYLNTATEKNVDAYVFKEEKIEGAVFGVYADSEIKNTLGQVVFKQGDLVKKCTTDKDGIAQFGGAMFVGKYYFQEIQTADDSLYKLDDKKYYFEVTGTEPKKTLTEKPLVNKQYKGSIKVIKTDGETTVALSDVEFNLMDAKKNVIGTYVTDTNGEIQINNLPIGTYYLQETKTQENYILDDTLRTVTISKEHLEHELSISNDRYKGSIKVIKTDGKTTVALSDVEFTLFDSDKNALGKYKTDKNGEILIDNLDVGTYYLQETKTKKGYKLDDKMVEVVISVDDLHKQVEMKNYRAETKITIKTDTTYSGSGKVRTGDMSPIGLIFMFLFASIMGLCLIHWKKVRTILLRSKKLTMIALVILATVSLGGLTVKAAVDLKEIASKELKDVEYNGKIYQYVLQKEYETSNPDVQFAFEEKIDGMKLADVRYETVDTILQKTTLEEVKEYKDLIVKDESKVAKTITVNGNVYDLQDVIWSEEPNLESVSYTVDYGYQTAEPKPDATYEYTYTSPVMKEENRVSLPFVRLEKGNEDWVDGFVATVTFHNLDGVYFTLGNHEFKYDAKQLSLTDKDFKELVRMLGYDTSKYRLNSISWSGKEYKKNNVTCRDAKATGQQYAASYKAHYEDEVENGKIYTARATYVCEVNVPADEAAPTYKVQATAYYEKGDVWTNIITFITEHKGVSLVMIGILLVVVIVTFLCIVKKRNTKITGADVMHSEE